MRNFDRIYLVYDNWNIHGFIPNGVDGDVFNYIKEIENKNIDGLEFELGRKFTADKYNTWTNYCGFIKTHQQLIDFVPYYYAATGACGNIWYYPIEFWGHWSHSVYDSNVFSKINPKIKDAINNGKGNLIINYSHEGYVSNFFIDSIITKLRENGFDLRNVLVIVNDFDIENKIKKYKQSKNNNLLSEKFFPKFINYSWYLLNSSEYFTKQSKYNFNIEGIDNKDKKFLSYNKNISQHRILFLIEQFENIKNNSLISFDKHLLSNICKRWFEEEASEDIKIKYEQLQDREVLDFVDMNNAHGYNCETENHYDRTLINITTETSFFDEPNYLSEKIWKPIWYGQPFILIGRPGSLKYLKELGFKTFDWLINEYYDNIENNEERFRFVMNEINRINVIDISKIKDKIKENFADLEHNRKLLEQIGKDRDTYEYKLYKKIKNFKNEKDYNVF